jgi:hypothetical protein
MVWAAFPQGERRRPASEIVSHLLHVALPLAFRRRRSGGDLIPPAIAVAYAADHTHGAAADRG